MIRVMKRMTMTRICSTKVNARLRFFFYSPCLSRISSHRPDCLLYHLITFWDSHLLDHTRCMQCSPQFHLFHQFLGVILGEIDRSA